MIHIFMGLVSLATAISAFGIMIHWWKDAGRDVFKFSVGRSLMFLMFSTGVIALTSTIASFTEDGRVFLIFQMLANVLLLVSVAMFGYSRFTIQRSKTKKERMPK